MAFDFIVVVVAFGRVVIGFGLETALFVAFGRMGAGRFSISLRAARALRG